MKKSFLFLVISSLFFTACSDDDESTLTQVPLPEGAVNMTEMCLSGGVLYGFLSQYDENRNTTITYMSLNTATGEVKQGWLDDLSAPSNPYKMVALGDYVCVTTSDYVNEGDAWLFSRDGELVDNFSTGVGPRCGVQSGNDIFILNEGLWGLNNSSLTKYDITDATVVKDCFTEQNRYGIGDTANDICAYGGKMYIAVSGENIILVTDNDARVWKKINTDAKPRYFATHGGYVYCTYYDGHLARIDTLSLSVDAKTAVGRNPEQVCVSGGKLFVANSGGLDYATELGYDKTVSVVDIESFTEIEKITVALNPANILTDDNGLVYLVSLGNYYDVPNTLQRIDPDTYEVTPLSE